MKIFTLSFDDGTVQDRRLVEIFNRYGLKCTFNINSGLFGSRHFLTRDGKQVCHDEIDAGETASLYAGHEIASHTLTHPNLLDCSDEEVVRQVREDCLALSALCGRPVTGMAYPGGPYYDERVIRDIVENTPVRWARNTASTGSFDFPERFMEWRPTCHMAEDIFGLAEKFLACDGPEDVLFYLWGHSFEFDQRDSWEPFERFCAFISGRADVSYMTNGEVYEYRTGKR